MDQLTADSNKIFLYKSIKIDLNKEFYLFSKDFDTRRVLSKLRVSDHNLAIEKGRYFNIPRQDRLCKNCNVVEDESHFLLHCKTNSNLRENMLI